MEKIIPQKYQEVEGCLITKALEGNFDVIVQGNNCFCKQKSGLAPQMVEAFNTDKFLLEHKDFKGDINKLGQIEYKIFDIKQNLIIMQDFNTINALAVINAYTQYHYGKNHSDGVEKPLDYEALTLCMRKINHTFKGKHIGLPGLIGAGLAGGDISRIREIIRKELFDCKTTIVFLPQNSHMMLEEFR